MSQVFAEKQHYEKARFVPAAEIWDPSNKQTNTEQLTCKGNEMRRHQ